MLFDSSGPTSYRCRVLDAAGGNGHASARDCPLGQIAYVATKGGAAAMTLSLSSVLLEWPHARASELLTRHTTPS
jgi:hypothetical protein